MAEADKSSDLDPKDKLEIALKHNRQMQLQLLTVNDKVQKLLKKVQETYEDNESILRELIQPQRRRGIGMRGAYLRGGTFFLKGNMFFKDFNCRNCPDNPDYNRRKANNEMFPMDLDLKGRHVWSIKDKKGVVEGIKEQIVVHLKNSGKEMQSLKSKELNSEKLVKLLEMVESDFQIDWCQISQHNLHHRHSAKSCEAIWNVFLHPSINRHKWTDEENLKLQEVSQKYNFQNWKAIATEIGARSDFQCFVQYQNYVRYTTPEKYSKWTKEDDARLIEVIERNTLNGIINWSNVMIHFPQKPKTTLQCRYQYSLDPHISRAPFTPEEDLLLLATIKEYGPKFSCFPKTLFPNRTTVQLRSRYRNTLVHRHKLKSWTLEDDTKLVEFVSKHGAKSWKLCEEFLQTHSRISCRTRYLVISNFFNKNPDATLAEIPRKRQTKWSYVNTQNWTEKFMELKENPGAQLVKKLRKPPKVPRKIKKKKPERKKKEKTAEIPKEPAPKIQKIQAVKKLRRKPIYIERLRVNTLTMYHSFKYSYDVQMGQDPCRSLNAFTCRKLNFVKHTLKLTELSGNSKRYQFDSNVPVNLRAKINKSLRQNTTYQLPDGFSLPPSWSTAVAFRALCIHSVRSDLQEVELPDLDNSNTHIEKFRKRLRALFYTTALLSRLHPSMVGVVQNEKEELISKPTNLEDQAKRKIYDEEEAPPPSESLHPKKKRKKVHKSATDQHIIIKEENNEI